MTISPRYQPVCMRYSLPKERTVIFVEYKLTCLSQGLVIEFRLANLVEGPLTDGLLAIDIDDIQAFILSSVSGSHDSLAGLRNKPSKVDDSSHPQVWPNAEWDRDSY